MLVEDDSDLEPAAFKTINVLRKYEQKINW